MHNQVSLRNRQLSRNRIFRFGAVSIAVLFAALFGAAVYQGTAPHDHAMTSLATLPFVAAGGLMFSNKPEEGGGGSSTQDEKCPVITGDSPESKVESAGGIITSLWERLSAMRTENTRLQQQFDTATSTAAGIQATLDSTKGELLATQGTIQTITVERDGFKRQLATAQGNVTRLESLCQLKGIDVNQTVPPITSPAGSMSTVDEWNTKIAAAKGNVAQMRVLEEFQAAVKAGTVKKAEPA